MVAQAVPMPRSRLHRFIEAILPWYSVEEEARRDARSEAIRQRSIAARMTAERIRADYEKAGARVSRR